MLRRPLGSRKVSVVVPADGVCEAGLIAEVEEVGAAAEDDVLGVDGLFEGGVVVGVGAAADVGAALEEGDFGAGGGEGGGGGESGYACAYDDDVLLRAVIEAILLRRAMTAPRARMRVWRRWGR